MTREEAERFVGTIETIFTDCPWEYEAIGVDLYAPGSPFEHVICPKNEHGDCQTDDCACEGAGEYWKTPGNWPAFLRDVLAALAPPAASETLDDEHPITVIRGLQTCLAGRDAELERLRIWIEEQRSGATLPPNTIDATIEIAMGRERQLNERDAEIERLTVDEMEMQVMLDKQRDEIARLTRERDRAAAAECTSIADREELFRLRSELSALREGVRDVLKVVTDFVARDQALIRLAALVKGKP